MVEKAGSSAARFSGAEKSSLRFRPRARAEGLSFRTSQTLTTTKNAAKPPSRKKEVGSPVRSEGTFEINEPVAARVSNKTPSTGNSDAVSAASAMASKSTSSTKGHTANERFASLKMGISTSTSASGGKSCAPQSEDFTPRIRCSQTGKTAWTMAKMK